MVKKLFEAKNTNNGIIAKMAGYICQAAAKSPWNKKTTERCKPQPRQSKPKICFEKHGSM